MTIATDVSVGDRLGPVGLDVSMRRMVVNVGAGWDFFPGHHDVDYARAQGHPTIFANTSLFLALADRLLAEWAGPRARVVRRGLAMRRPVYLGEVMSAAGLVVAVRSADRRVDVRIEIGVRDDVRAEVEATVELPGPGRD